MSLGNSSFIYSPSVNLWLPLDFYFQEIERLLVVTPRGWLSRLLNKKRSQKKDKFEQLTWKKPSRFEHIECDFSSSQQRICKSGIWGNAVQKSQNQSQNQS